MDHEPTEDLREAGDRREFLKKAGKLAVTVPAVALLLSANATPAQASGRYGRQGGRHEGWSRGKGRSRGHARGKRH